MEMGKLEEDKKGKISEKKKKKIIQTIGNEGNVETIKKKKKMRTAAITIDGREEGRNDGNRQRR